MRRILLALPCAMAMATSAAYSQGAFEDFDFESAKIVPISTNAGNVFVAATNALPGWSLFSGTSPVSSVVYNPLGNIIYNVPFLYGFNSAVLSGNFSFELGRGSLSQAGLVPAGTKSLLFEMKILAGTELSVSLGGQPLSYTAISSFSNYTLYGADISAFAGQAETLAFSSASGSGDVLDNIQFSSQPIPEPSVLSLIFLAGGVLVSLRARRRTAPVRSRPAGGCRT